MCVQLRKRKTPPRIGEGHGVQDLCDQVVAEFFEDGDVFVAVLDGVLDGEGPFFFAARGHVDTAVHRVDPGQFGQFAILIGLERLVIGDLDRREVTQPLELIPTV